MLKAIQSSFSKNKPNKVGAAHFFFYIFLSFIIVLCIQCYIILGCTSVWNLIIPIVSSLFQLFLSIFLIYRIGSMLKKTLAGMFTDPMVKKSMTVLGKMGGDRKSINAAKEKMAKDLINKQYGKYKPIVEAVAGIDVDEYLEEHGALNVLEAVREFAPVLGIDLQNIGANVLSPGNKSNTGLKNPYLERR